MYATSERQIDLFVDPSTDWGKEIVAFSKSQGQVLNVIDITNNKITGTRLLTVAEKLNISIGDLIDREDPAVKKHVGIDSDLDNDGWIKVINHDYRVLTSPIAVKGDRIGIIKQPADILKL